MDSSFITNACMKLSREHTVGGVSSSVTLLRRRRRKRKFSLRKKSTNSDDTEIENGTFFDGYDQFIQSLEDDDDGTSTEKADEGPKNGSYQRRRARTNSKSNQFVRRRKYNNEKGGVQYRNRNINNPNRKFTRDPMDDTSIRVDEKVVNYLLSLRQTAQRKKDFSLADEVRDELNNVHGVYVWDKDKLWSASPVSPSYRRARGSQNEGGFGIHGHDYVQIGDTLDPQICTLSIKEVHELLAQRLQYKLLREYKLADQVQVTLFKHGIRVHDGLKQWRGDGGIFADIEGMVSNETYSQNAFSLPIQTEKLSLDNIRDLINKRCNARKKSEFEYADMIRDDLWETYNVAVDDITRTWSIGGDFGPDAIFRWTDDGPVSTERTQNRRDWRKQGMYTQSTFSKELADPNVEEEVLNLISDRLEARRVKDFHVSDYILEYLYENYDVSVDDRIRQWSVGGDFGDDLKQLRTTSPTAPDGTIISQPVRVYSRRGGKGQLLDKDLRLIDAMIQRRAEELSRFNYKAAESIKSGLRNKFYVIIDDSNYSWHIRGNDYCLSPMFNGSLPESIQESRGEIEKLIRERVQARKEKDFKRADAIRSDLFKTYGIKIDDKVKEWSVIPLKQSNTEESKDFQSNSCETVSLKIISKESDEKSLDVENESISSNDDNFTQMDLEKLTVVKLKELLRKFKLPVSGRKSDLIERIMLAQNL